MPVLWFGLGVAFCWLAEGARRSFGTEDDFDERLAALEAEADARVEALASTVETH